MEALPADAEAALRQVVPEEQVATDAFTRIAFAPDAGLYWYVPKAVVFPRTLEDIRQLFAWSRNYRIPLTFRAAGTSLSGQAVTDGVLVEVRRYWQRWEILRNGAAIRAQPGVRAGLLNQALRPYWRRLGPDPASVDVCTLGGIVANNASGMCCGTRDTAYRTLESLLLVLPSGLVLDTARPDADAFLAEHAPELSEGLLRIRRRILHSASLCERIQRKYQLKNTVGYSLNAFVDFDSPAQILAHLMVGSEGTLGFLADIVLRTVPDPPLRLTAFALFPSPEQACQAVALVRDLGADAVELLDSASLRSLAGRPGIAAEFHALPDAATALLIEYRRWTESEHQACRKQTQALLDHFPLLAPPLLTAEEEQQAHLWAARRSLYPLVAARRPLGTTPISEDIAVPLEALPDTVRRLRQALTRHGYPNAVIFGHAKDGNLHFVLPQPLRSEQDTARYAALLDEVVALVLEHGGSLKAEHGTGRNMAPFVRAEWGDDAYELMWELKRLIDPEGILNPDVILSRHERVHVRNLKRTPLLGSDADRCMECGFCEPVCPSRTLTLTPRQRIALLRYAPALQDTRWRYAVIDTCAADGLCQLRCPVGIDTGKLVRELRQRRHHSATNRLTVFAARHYGWVDAAVRATLAVGRGMARVLGASRLERLTAALHRVSGRAFPLWHSSLRSAPLRLPSVPPLPGIAVLFPGCGERWLGSTAPADILALSQQFGEPLAVLPSAERLCCGLVFASKGFLQAAEHARQRLLEAASQSHPHALIVVGNSCALWLKSTATAAFPILDALEYAARLSAALQPRRRQPALRLHIPCSLHHMGLADTAVQLARACAETVSLLPSPECCGAAGDLWLRRPELSRSAGSRLLAPGEAAPGYTTNAPCARALEMLSTSPWHSLTALLRWATAPAESLPQQE
ncbi:putative FAD-linked oxidoreductase [bacterium HR21]|nr:putative FAD-linked oxidoreductase [bacterium HR21]